MTHLITLNLMVLRMLDHSHQIIYIINSGNFNRAFKYSKKLDRKNIDNFE